MVCEFYTPTGAKSKFHESLEAKYGGVVAKKLWLLHKTQGFKDTYNHGFRQNGEPTIKGFEAWHKENVLPYPMNPVSDAVVKKQIAQLTKVFDDAGIEVNFKPDTNYNGAAKIERESGTDVFTIIYNPVRINADSLYHEAGHLLVDLRGIHDVTVRRAIKSLRGSLLWNTVQAQTGYVGTRLEREVLTTAIGLEAVNELDKWLDKRPLIIRRLLRFMSEFFGIEVDAVRRLAKGLTGGKVRGNLNNILQEYQEFQQQSLIDETDAVYVNAEVEWLTQQKANLRKMAARFGHQGGRSQEFAEHIMEVLEEMEELDTSEAILKYMQFAQSRISSLEGRFLEHHAIDETTYVRTKDLTYEDFTQLDPEEQKKLVSFLYYTSKFVNQWVHIGDLPVVSDGNKKRALEMGKALADRVRDLDKLWLQLSKEVYTKLVEASSNPQFGGRGAIEQVQEFFDVQNDENWAQRRLDAMADTNNPLVANLMKVYARNSRKMKNEVKRRTQEWNKRLKEAADAAGMKPKDFLLQYMEKDSDGNYTGRMIGEINYSGFYEEKDRIIFARRDPLLDRLRVISRADQNLFEVLYDFAKTGNSTDAYVDAYNSLSETGKAAYLQFYEEYRAYASDVRAWFQANTRPVEGAAELVAEQAERLAAGDITQSQYDAWMKANTGEAFDGSLYYKGNLVEPNREIWSNGAISNLNQEFMAYMQGLLSDLIAHTSTERMLATEGEYGNIITRGYFPALPNDERSRLEKLIQGVGWYDAKDRNVAVDENGEVIRFFPLRYVNMLSSENFENSYLFSDGKTGADIKAMTEEDRDAWIADNKSEWRKMKRASHGAAMEKDLDLAISMFINHATTHKYKKSIEHELLVAREILRRSKMYKKSGKGENIKDKFLSEIMGTDRFAEIDGDTSATFAHFEDWLQMVFYDDFEVDEGLLTKVSRVLQNWTSLKGLGFNPLSAINNVTYGTIQIQIEKLAGQHFGGRKVWIKAKRMYGDPKNAISYFADIGNDQASTKLNAFFRHYDILRTQEELAHHNGMERNKKSFTGTLFSTQSLYALQHIGEHMMQNQALLAMANSHRIVNGRIVSFDEFIQADMLAIDLNDTGTSIDYDTARENIKANKAKKAELKEQWETYPTVYDSYNFEDGYVTLREDVELIDGEEADFEQKVLSVNHYLHGIYNREDAGAIQKYALGRLAVHFRKWMRPGWNKRFGSRWGQTYWNERRNMKDEGTYVTAFKFFTSPMRDENGQMINIFNNENGAAKAMANIATDYMRFVRNMKVHWHTLDNHEKANVMRALGEMAFLAFALLVGGLLRGLKDDDDKAENSLALYAALHQADRTVTELASYTPVYGWFNEGKKLLRNPMAASSTASSILKLLWTAIESPFIDPEDRNYKGGMFYGENKVLSQLLRNLPVLNQFYRIGHLENNYRFYKLY